MEAGSGTSVDVVLENENVLPVVSPLKLHVPAVGSKPLPDTVPVPDSVIPMAV